MMTNAAENRRERGEKLLPFPLGIVLFVLSPYFLHTLSRSCNLSHRTAWVLHAAGEASMQSEWLVPHHLVVEGLAYPYLAGSLPMTRG